MKYLFMQSSFSFKHNSLAEKGGLLTAKAARDPFESTAVISILNHLNNYTTSGEGGITHC